MKLLHYTDKEFELDPTMEYDQQIIYWKNKPRGLWVSVEGPYDWKWWCENEEFRLENLSLCYEVKLKRGAKILRLKNSKSILDFTKSYPYTKPQWDNAKGRRISAGYELDWDKVKKEYQGIIIAPYQWKCRLALETPWYYGWDCASGCLWDLSCIKEFTLRKP